MKRALSLVGILTAVAAIHVGVARADFTETFCSGGSAAAPWIQGGGGGSAWVEFGDSCGSGGEFGFDNATTSLPGQAAWGAEILAPAGEVFTGESLTFSTEPRTSGSETFVVLGDDQTILSEYETDDGATHSFSSALPDASGVWARYDCSSSASTGCNLAAFPDTLGVGAMSLTIHDTGAPSVAAAGGSLATDGARLKGTQPLLYHATDTGSGVERVTASLGTTVVGTTTSTCQSASLTPCPASTSGTVAANTALVPDGTYPVILTAYDVSGDADPIQVATVTIANHAGHTTIAPHRHGRAITSRVTFHWDARRIVTRLDYAAFARLPRSARVTIICTGRHCPFHTLRADARHIHGLEHRLHHRDFRAGQSLHLTITAPHRTAERGTILIRHGRLPVTTTARRRRR